MDTPLPDDQREALLVRLHAASGHAREELGGIAFEFADPYDERCRFEEHLGTFVVRCGRCGRVDREVVIMGLWDMARAVMTERGWTWRPVTRCPDCPRAAP